VRVSVSDAKGQLTELVRRAEAGEDVILTRHGHDAVRLAPVRETARAPAARQALIEAACAEAAKTRVPGASAARSQDFLYSDDGLPG
jgi:prevent-host-death family protein